MANLCSASHRSTLNPCELIRKAVALIENPLSSDYIDRHVLIINDFLEACTYAIVSFSYTSRYPASFVKKLHE